MDITEDPNAPQSEPQVETPQPESTQTSQQPSTPQETKEIPTQAVDVEGITKSIRETVTGEVSKSILEKISGALGLNKEEKKSLPTDPEELAKFVREEAAKGTRDVLTSQQQAEQEAERAREEQVNQGAQRFQTLWKDQYSQLAESGKVPKIVNENDPNDPGNQAKVKILAKLKTILDENQAKGIDYVPTLKEVFYENPNVLSTETQEGLDVPVSGGGRTIATTGTGMSHDQLSKTSIEDLVAKKYSN